MDKQLGKGSWLDRLADTLDERVGEKERKDLVEAGGEISESSSLEKKAAWTKCMMECLEAKVDEKTCRGIMSNNLHVRLPNTGYVRRLRAIYKKQGDIDEILGLFRRDWLDRIEKKYGRQSESHKLVESDPTVEAGVRKGNVVYVSKVPFNLKGAMNTADEKEKHYRLCHCGWVRFSLLKGEKRQISRTSAIAQAAGTNKH